MESTRNDIFTERELVLDYFADIVREKAHKLMSKDEKLTFLLAIIKVIDVFERFIDLTIESELKE